VRRESALPDLLADDPDRIGHALLRPDSPRSGPLSVSIRFLDGTYLGEGGRRTPARHLFAAEPRDPPGTYALGPAVTAHVLEAEVVAFADADGVPLGTPAWDGIRPPPNAARGALLGASERGAGSLNSASRPATATVTALVDPPSPDPIAPPRPPTVESAPLLPAPARRGRALGIVAALALIGSAAAWAALVLSGRAGWTVEPGALSLSPSGLIAASARLRPSWAARPLAGLVSSPFVVAALPDGLSLDQARDGDGWVLRAAVAPGTPRPGRREAHVPVTFLLGGAAAGLHVDVALVMPGPAPSPPPPALTPAPLPNPPAPPPARSTVDDAACDRAAGNRLDPDHPPSGGSVEDVFALAPAAVEAGIAACDPRTDRGGPDRRLVVERGRLLAARALARAAHGDAAGARADMDGAVADWRAGSALGSGFADSLLGVYLFGAFDRPALSFIRPDDSAATEAWRRGAARGSVASQRNYAAQLLAGHGVSADPARALGLLRDALARGDEAAAGVLGVAFYTGYPPGVPRDPAEGWRLIVRAQCLDRPSADLLVAEISRGAKPAGDRRTCP